MLDSGYEYVANTKQNKIACFCAYIAVCDSGPAVCVLAVLSAARDAAQTSPIFLKVTPMICFNDLLRNITPPVLIDFIVQAVKSMPKDSLLQLIVKLTEYCDTLKGDVKDGEHTVSDRRT